MRYLWLIFAITALGGGAWLGYEEEWFFSAALHFFR